MKCFECLFKGKNYYFIHKFYYRLWKREENKNNKNLHQQKTGSGGLNKKNNI